MANVLNVLIPSALLGLGVLTAGEAAATTSFERYPAKPVRFIVPFTAGGGQDMVARTIAAKLTAAMGVRIVVDNRPGANTILGTSLAAKAPADGYTILSISTAFTANPALKKLQYDALGDFTPVTQTITLPYLLTVNPSLPVHAVADIVNMARARPGALNYGSGGTGGGGHLAGELFKQMSGVDMVHIPYRGGAAPAITALLGNQIQLVFAPAVSAMPQVKAGRLRVIATTGARRTRMLPDVVTVAEAGLAGYQASGWYGIVAPAGTSPQIVTRLNAEIVKILRSEEIARRFADEGGDVVANAPAVFQAFIREETTRWTKVIHTAGITDD